MRYEELKIQFEKIIEEHVRQAIDEAKRKWLELYRPEIETLDELKKGYTLSPEFNQLLDNYRNILFRGTFP